MIRYAGQNRHTLNCLKAICFDDPEWTPCRVGLMPETWMKYRAYAGGRPHALRRVRAGRATGKHRHHLHSPRKDLQAAGTSHAPIT
jgi:hypothetical protein